jgi:hypothetical protein
VALLNKGYEERFYSMLLIPVEPEFDPLRGDPGFQKLLQIVKSPPPGNLP